MPAVLDPNNPLSDTARWLLVIGFPKNRSPYLNQAIALAEQADAYGVLSLGGTPFYCAGYGRSQASAAAAFGLLRYVAEWRAVRIHAASHIVTGPYGAYPVMETLSCYLDALRCQDSRAHCQKVIRSPFISDAHYSPFPEEGGPERKRYLFPCRLLEPFAEIGRWHPASPQAIIQARAVDRRVDWCPCFDPEAFCEVGDGEVI